MVSRKNPETLVVSNSLTATRMAFTKLQRAYAVSQQGIEGKKAALQLITEAEEYVHAAKSLLSSGL